MKSAAIKVLVDFASSQVHSQPIDRQVLVYQALAELLPSYEERRRALDISMNLSRVAGMQLDFTRDLFKHKAADYELHANNYKGDGK